MATIVKVYKKDLCISKETHLRDKHLRRLKHKKYLHRNFSKQENELPGNCSQKMFKQRMNDHLSGQLNKGFEKSDEIISGFFLHCSILEKVP